MFAYTVTNQVINTFVEVILPYFMRGVDDVKNGKGVGNFRGNKKRVVFEDEKADVKEERQFLERVRHEVSLPAYSLFGACQLCPGRIYIQKNFRRLCGNGYPVRLCCVVVNDLAPGSMCVFFPYIYLGPCLNRSSVMALLNNWLELRSDAFKITTHNRRPLPSRVDTIGPWVDSLVRTCITLLQMLAH